MQAAAVLNNKGGNLSDKQMSFAYDSLSSFQMLNQMEHWETQYLKKGAATPETAPGQLQPAADSNKKSP